RAGALLGADRLEPVGALVHDPRHASERLDVVDDRGATVQPDDGRERGLQPRLPALALQRLDEPGLLTANVSARTAVNDEIDVDAASEHVLAEESLRIGLLGGPLEDQRLGIELAADVDEGLLAANRNRRDRDAFDEQMRVEADDVPI